MHQARVHRIDDVFDDEQQHDADVAFDQLVDRIDDARLDHRLRIAERYGHRQHQHDDHAGLDHERHDVDGRDGHDGLDRLGQRQRDGQHGLEHEQRDGNFALGHGFEQHALMTMRYGLLVLAMATSLGLAACKRGSEADEHATAGAPVPKGATGSGVAGTSAMGGPGSGLNGGLAPSGSASSPTGVAEGSANRTPRGSVGNR